MPASLKALLIEIVSSLRVMKKVSTKDLQSRVNTSALSPNRSNTAIGAGSASTAGLSRNANQYFYDAIRIGTIGRVDGNANSPEPVRKGPVDKSRPHQLAIGNNDIGAIGRAQHAGAETNLTDFAENRSNLDGIPHLHGVFKYENETRNKVVHHVLQTKPYTDAEGTDQQG